MAGLYIHVPFCKTVCGYCDFYKTTRTGLKNVYLNSLLREIDMISSKIIEYPIRTIYFGGGTPSLLQRNDFELIFSSLTPFVDLNRLEEVTVEVNPDDFTERWVNDIVGLPVNRLSFGIQSVYDDLLKMMGRRHSVKQALSVVDRALLFGFDNITVDLIYGLPGLSVDRWNNTIDLISSLSIKHVSAYHLTYEKGTRFYEDLKKGLKTEISDESSIIQYKLLCEKMFKNGFVDYEISNFSLPGFESKHNSLYWSGEEYFGLGPSAHSFYDGIRRYNISDLSLYSDLIVKGDRFYEEEILSLRDVYNETIMLGLRQRKGIELFVLERLGDVCLAKFLIASKKFVDNGDLLFDGACYKVSEKSKFITDYIIQSLFDVEE
ncbi:MAG: radical SAM family heme chaperone HemW [Breznakibacter sp.]